MTEVQIQAGDNSGSFMAYMALPENLPAPAIIVIQEIFGVNQNMRDKCDDMAKKGYVAICPDLFWRIEPGVNLTDKTDAEWEKAFDLFGKFDVDMGVEDLKTTLDFIRNSEHCTGKVGNMGYCLGGKLSYLMACRSDCDASVGYYGVGLDELMDEAKHIENPLMLHIAGQDEFVPPEAQQKVHATLDGHVMAVLHDYPEMNHAFTRIGGKHYDEQNAVVANKRTDDFLSEKLALKQKAA